MLSIDADRFRSSFEAYSAIGATEDGGLHRLALSDADREARDRLADDLEALGLDVHVDAVGNMFARRPGRRDVSPVLVGSHLDSQPYGGRFDGQLGVLVALETLRALEDAGVETDRPVELVNWTNEEGSRFKPALMGSGAWTGAHDPDDVLEATDADGRTVAEELSRIGYDGAAPIEPRDAHAYLELHVEQGPTLDDRGLSVGVVEGVYGMAWLEVTVRGQADHAGPTPMHSRHDALVAAATAIERINALPGKLAADAVATVGEFSVAPDSINVIPSRATFTVDVRSYDDGVVREAVRRVEREVATACKREGASFDLEVLWRVGHREFSPAVRDAVARAADEVGAGYERLVSGAGHDASYLDDVTDAGMVFVPSVDGRTHCETEYTEWGDVIAGAEVYANATLALATE